MRSRSLLLVAVACAWACGEAAVDTPPPGAGAPPAPAAAPATKAAHPAPEAAGQPFIGVVKPRRAVNVAPAEGGELAAVHVRAGDTVAKGDAVATLDDRPIREALRTARAELRSAQGRLRRAEINRTEARRKLETERELVAAGTSARRALEDAEVALQRAEADVRAAQFAINEIRVRVDTADRRLEGTELEAPFDGTVSVRFREPGSRVAPGEWVVRIISNGSPFVVFAVPPDRRQDIALDNRVAVEVDNLEPSLTATVRQISPELDSASNMFFVEAELDVPAELEDRIQPRLAARVTSVSDGAN